jgi:hypothetical protein
MLRPVLAACAAALILATPAHAATWTRGSGVANAGIAASWQRVNVAGAPEHAGAGLVVASYGDHNVAVLSRSGSIARTYDFGSLCGSGRAGTGKVVAACSAGTTRWLAVLDLAAGAITQLTPPKDFDEGDASVAGIGGHWVMFSLSGNHYSFYKYWNPDTGEIRGDPDATHTPDLDAEELAAPLCAPVRRPRSFTDETDPFDPVTVIGRRVVFLKQESVDDPLELLDWRCGQAKPKRLTSCVGDEACGSFDADSRHVVWGTRRGVIALDRKSGKRTTLSGLRTSYTGGQILLQGDRVYVTRYRPGHGTLTYTRRLR